MRAIYGFKESNCYYENMPPLEYAPQKRTSWLQRRSTQRLLIGVSIAIGILAAAYIAPAVWREAQTKLTLRRCMRFTASENKICFDGDPATSPSLVYPGSDYRNELDHEARLSSPVASWKPQEWRELIRCLDPTLKTFRLSPPLVFLHERTSTKGHQFLVVLRYVGNVTSEGGPTNHVFDFDLIEPSSWPSAKSVRTFQTTMLCVSQPISKIYFGQPDATDLSHFHFRYKTEEGAGTVDGWLRNDHELVLECRDGPEKGK